MMNRSFARSALAASLVVLPLGAPAAAEDLKTLTDGWNTLLQKHVRTNGGVNYIGLEQDQAALDRFLAGHAALDPKALDDAGRKAVYINLYNATMMANLLKHAKAEKIDVKSQAFTQLKINDIKVPGGNIWNGDYKVKLAGHDVTLDDLEHGLIRGTAKGELGDLKVKTLDPRIHAAVNCAALSCPRVREVAYRPETVEQMLEENIKEFLSSEAQFSKLSDGKIKANSIVFWYYDDFDDHGEKVLKLGGAGDYLAPFVQASAKDRDWKVKHLKENFNDRGKVSLKLSSAFEFEYDWLVNDVRNKK